MSNLTRGMIEQVVISRVGGWMSVVKMDITTMDGTNADLSDPIGQAVRNLGYPMADPIAPTDADIAPIPSEDFERVFSVSTYATTQTVFGRFYRIDEWAGTDKQAWDDLGKRIQKALADQRDALAIQFGYGGRLKRNPRVQPIAAGIPWPPNPPPPSSSPPWPPGTTPRGPSGVFNP